MTNTLARAEGRQQKFERAFWLLVLVVFVIILWYVPQSSFGSVAASLMLAGVALAPSWLWIRDGASDVPLYPVFSLSFLWAYALPLLGEQSNYARVEDQVKVGAGAALAMGLVIGTATWYWFRKGVPTMGRSLHLPVERMKGLLLGAMIGEAIFMAGHVGQWFDFVPSEVLALFRVIIMSLYTLAVFVHFHEIGRGAARGIRAFMLIALFAVCEMATSISLLLVGSMLSVLIALAAFTLGRGSVPWKTALSALLLFSVLHAGKGEMRDKYWFSNLDYVPQPTEYLPLYVEWFESGLEAFVQPPAVSSSDRTYQSLRERAGLAYIFLMVFDMSPESIPYLGGASYAPIPKLLVPRFINPDRESTHEGTIILNLHYGLQTRETAATATLAWDLVGEALANFGITGVWTICFLFGWFYARVERWARGRDIFSFRMMVALIVMSLAVQSGMTLAVYVTSMMQSMVALLLLAVVAMERRQVQSLVASLTAARFRIGGNRSG